EALVMVVHPSMPAKTVSKFIADAKTNPGKIRMAMTSTGSSPHVTGKLFQMMTSVDVVHVPYAGGGPALKDLVDGKVQMMFEPMSASIGPIRSGALRALAVTTTERSPSLPGIPAVAESVSGFDPFGGNFPKCPCASTIPTHADAKIEHGICREDQCAVNGGAIDVVQAPKREARIMRYERSDYE